MAQNYAARLILRLPKFSSASKARCILGWPTLNELRNHQLIKLHTSTLPNAPKPPPDYLLQSLQLVSNLHDHFTRASSKGCYTINSIKTDYGRHAISYRLSKLSHSL